MGEFLLFINMEMRVNDFISQVMVLAKFQDNEFFTLV
jgi:hypothetical protein